MWKYLGRKSAKKIATFFIGKKSANILAGYMPTYKVFLQNLTSKKGNVTSKKFSHYNNTYLVEKMLTLSTQLSIIYFLPYNENIRFDVDGELKIRNVRYKHLT